MSEGDWAAAAESYRLAVGQDDTYLAGWHDLAIACYRLEDWESAAAALDRALSLAPGDADLLYKKGVCQAQAGLASEAIETLEAAAASGEHLEACYELGLLLAREGQRRRPLRQRAAEQFERILRAVEQGGHYGQVDRVCFALGSLYGEEEETRPQAAQAFRRGLVANPLSAVGHSSLGLLLMESGQTLGALGEFKVAIQLDPGLSAAYTGLARLLHLHVERGALELEYAHIVEEFGPRASHVLARLSEELIELARQQTYEGLYTKGHQLKNLLGIAGSRLRGLARREVPGACADELEGLRQEHERLYQEWVGFLGAMKPEVVRPAVVEPARLVQRVVAVLRSQAGCVPVDVRVQEGVPRIMADERMLREAVTNLCLNAVQALEEHDGGRVTVGVGYDAARAGVFIEVEDDGPGIPEEHLERIFDAGFTTKKQGNGYGLSIARRIARAHHGELRVKSRVGRGTVFRLDLPVQLDAGTSEEGLSLRHAGQPE